jgi:hypothetical protein
MDIELACSRVLRSLLVKGSSIEMLIHTYITHVHGCNVSAQP